MLNATRTISGTVFGGDELRITNIDGYEVDLPPAEHMLFFNNIDRPGKRSPCLISTIPRSLVALLPAHAAFGFCTGVLRQVAARLAKGGINIAHFSLGRKPHGNAMGALVLDEPVPPEVFEEVIAAACSCSPLV
jgi:D-3-phosphoglycerate dehydrogenase